MLQSWIAHPRYHLWNIYIPGKLVHPIRHQHVSSGRRTSPDRRTLLSTHTSPDRRTSVAFWKFWVNAASKMLKVKLWFTIHSDRFPNFTYNFPFLLVLGFGVCCKKLHGCFRTCIYPESQQLSNISMMPHCLTLAVCAVSSFHSKCFANCTSIKRLAKRCIIDSNYEEWDKLKMRNTLLKREEGVCSLKMSMSLKTKIKGKN